MPVDRWEYAALEIERRSRFFFDRGDWFITLEEGRHIIGLENILDYFGEDGWELVSMIPTGYNANFGLSRSPVYLTLAFKRRQSSDGS
jgi:hypothetical protein